jgi:hypothetical protein
VAARWVRPGDVGENVSKPSKGVCGIGNPTHLPTGETVGSCVEEAAYSLDGGNASPWIANDWFTDGLPKHLRVHGFSMYSLVPAERYRWREGGAPVIESVEKTEARR